MAQIATVSVGGWDKPGLRGEVKTSAVCSCCNCLVSDESQLTSRPVSPRQPLWQVGMQVLRRIRTRHLAWRTASICAMSVPTCVPRPGGLI